MPSSLATPAIRRPGQGPSPRCKVAGRHFLRSDGSLGWAFPAALGAQLAAPDKQVVCIIGDGGIGYHIADIETARRQELPVIVIVLNNGTLAFEATCRRCCTDTWSAQVDDFFDVDYGKVARAFGANGVRVRTSPSSAGRSRRPSSVAARSSSTR